MNTQARWAMMVMIVSVGLVGCTGTGQTINFDLHASPSSVKSEAYHDDSLTILVEPFQDKRTQTNRIGSRTHFWGGATHFTVWNGHIGKGMADLAQEYLQQRGWNAIQSPNREAGLADAPADVILTGDVLTFAANAKSGFGFTKIDVQIQVGFEAKNAVDGSTVKMVLGANGTDTVATFNSKDVERLTNQVAKDLFTQLFHDLTVKNKAIHLKSNKLS